MQQRLVKLLKHAKTSKALNLHKCIVQYDSIPDPMLVQIAKKVSRVKSLSLPDYMLSQELLEKYTLWLKYAKGLRKFNYIAPPCADFPNGTVRKIETILKKFFHEIRRDRINSLNISHKTSDEKAGNSFLLFKQYPSTLKSLTFDWRHYSVGGDASQPCIASSLAHMKDLDSVSLAFRNQANLIDPILASIPNPSQIKTLKIEFLENLEQGAALPFERLANFPNLANLTLKLGCWPRDLEVFLTYIQHYPLKKFYLDVMVTQDTQLQAVKNLVDHLRGLESLTLKIDQTSHFESEGLFKELCKKVSLIRPLKNLKLHLKASSRSDNGEHCSFNIVPSLKGIFAKPVKLEKFSFKFNKGDSQGEFFELVGLLTRGAPTLKKLEIDVGEFKPRESDYVQLINFVKRLHSVEVLKLNSLSVIVSQFVQELLDSAYNLRSLKKFELREIKGALNKASFMGLLEKILSKKGLKKFDCVLSWESREAARRTRGSYKIDLKEVVKRNSELEKYPQSGALYVCYDDDVEWKW